jgi:hypothetical protein
VGASYPLAPRISTQSAPSDHPSSPAWQARRVARVNGVEHAQWMQMQCRLRQPHMRAWWHALRCCLYISIYIYKLVRSATFEYSYHI